MNYQALQIKQALLEYGLCKESDYLKKYVDLVTKNLTTMKVYGTTQSHHVIPLSYYEQININFKTSTRKENELLAAKDPNNFIINLTSRDHIRAHCYLALASAQCWFTFDNMQALTLLGCKTNDPTILLTLIQDNVINPVSKLCWVNKNGNYKRISTNKLSYYLEHGWTKGAKNINTALEKSKATKEKKVCMHKDFEDSKVPTSKVKDKLLAGWKLGSTKRQLDRTTYFVHNSTEEKRIEPTELISYLELGWIYGRK